MSLLRVRNSEGRHLSEDILHSTIGHGLYLQLMLPPSFFSQRRIHLGRHLNDIRLALEQGLISVHNIETAEDK